MKSLPTLLTLLAASLMAVATSPGCAAQDGTDDSDCRGGKCDDLDKPDDEIEDTICDGVMVDMSGRNNGKVAGRLNDGLSRAVFRQGDSCPTTYAAVMAALRKSDTEGCSEEDPKAGIKTRLVSETAQASGTATSFRAVVTRKCNNRPTHGIMFSLFGVAGDATTLPSNWEGMAFDESTGAFNYYESDGNKINFFGNSKDLLKGAAGQVRRCAQCHTGGGAIMKELDTPWLHWEGHMDHPGARELVDRFDDFGTKATGSEFESTVKAANRVWNEERLKHAKANLGTKELLRPLFCSVEVNLDNGADFESPVAGGEGGDEVDSIPHDSLLDKQLKGFGSTPINFADYDALIKSSGSRVRGVQSAIDTVFDYVFIERSHADDDYVNKLKDDGVIDDEFIKDVLMVDFTRPIFSDDRCGLLDFAPVLTATNTNPDSLRAGFIANLGAAPAGSAEAEFKNNLENREFDHGPVVDGFLAACAALEPSEFLNNAYQITSLNRRIAGELHVFEFASTMPTDNLNVPAGSRLGTDCQIRTTIENITPPGESGGPEPTMCVHDECEEGVALDPACSPCAAAVIAAYDFCGNVGWNEFCVEKVDNLCNKTCAAPVACAHSVCEEGEALDPACSQEAAAVCDADAFCCNNTHDNLCVDKATELGFCTGS